MAGRRVALLLALAGLAPGGETAPPATAALPAPVFTAAISGEVLHANVLRVLGLVVYDVQTTPRLADGVLTFTACSALAYGGQVGGEVSVDLATGVQRYRLTLTGADVAHFLLQRFDRDDGSSGLLDGELDLTVPPGDAAGITGTGRITVRQANFSVLRIGQLASLLIGSMRSGPAQDSGRADLVFGGGRVRLDRAIVRTPDAELRVRGSVGFDGSLDLLIMPRAKFGMISAIWLLGDLFARPLGSISSRVARVRVRGHVSRPVFVLDPFGD